jgi:hypothetical protein
VNVFYKGLIRFQQVEDPVFGKAMRIPIRDTAATQNNVHPVFRSEILTTILKWIQNNKTKKFTHKTKTYAGAQVNA